MAREAPEALVVGPGLQTMDAVQVIQTLRTVMGQVDLPIVSVGEGTCGEEPVADTVAADLDPAQIAVRIGAAVQRRHGFSEAAAVEHPPTPVREADRLRALRATGILDTPPEERFDRITREASEQLQTSMATISLVDSDRQWFKSRQGLEQTETPREVSFCGHAINYEDGLVVADARLDPRFAMNPLVDGGVRSYAGRPIRSPDGHVIGMMCVMDDAPRDFGEEELDRLASLRDQVEQELWDAESTDLEERLGERA